MQSLSICLAISLFFQISSAFGQDSKIKIPDFNDKYTSFVKQLESGKTDMDFTDFRNSFLESEQFSKKGEKYSDLEKKINEALKKNDNKKVKKLAEEMLSIDYTSMFAHKLLQQSYKLLGDTTNSNKYHDIEFGLINSIINSGDGKTCETGWHVTQVEEEYFILSMMDVNFISQGLMMGGKNSCDRMTVKTSEGETKSYYF